MGPELGAAASEYRPLRVIPALAADLSRGLLHLGDGSGHSNSRRGSTNGYAVP